MAAFLEAAEGRTPVPKIIFSHGQLPQLDQPVDSTWARKPFSTISSCPWAQAVEITLPEDLYRHVWPSIEALQKVEYARVHMPLSAILQADRFSKCIKTGGIEMLSEGQPGHDSKFSFKDGVLRLELPKELYERAGIVGRAIAGDGRKHIRARFVVEIDLRAPSMVPGKKGYERIAWAFKNVLSQSVTWLVRTTSATAESNAEESPLASHQPLMKQSLPHIESHKDIMVPPMRLPRAASHALSDTEDAVDLLEWIGMLPLKSPRVKSGNQVDSYLSRYGIPDKDKATRQELVSLVWQGFLSAQWVQQLSVAALKAAGAQQTSWLAVTVHTLPVFAGDECDGYVLLKLPPNEGQVADEHEDGDKRAEEYYLWEMRSSIDKR